jgi:AcrR family transcriptional regulator
MARAINWLLVSRYGAEMRVYGSRTAEQRQQERRERLVDAGQALFGTVGVAATSVRMVLREAGLQDRYFAESFSSISDLLIAVHDRVHSLVLARMQAAVTETNSPEQNFRALITALVRFAETNQPAMRVKIVETLGVTPAVDARRLVALRDYAVLVEELLPARASGPIVVDRATLSGAIVSGVNGMLLDWITGEATSDGQQVIDIGTLLYAGVVRVLTGEIRSLGD